MSFSAIGHRLAGLGGLSASVHGDPGLVMGKTWLWCCNRSKLTVADLAVDEHPIEHAKDRLGRVEIGGPEFGQRCRTYLVERLRHAR